MFEYISIQGENGRCENEELEQMRKQKSNDPYSCSYLVYPPLDPFEFIEISNFIIPIPVFEHTIGV